MMNTFNGRCRSFTTAAVAMLFAVSPILAFAQARLVQLPAGAVIPVRLDTPLSSKTNRPGDRFSATVKYGRDDAGMPEGTRVEGVVREAIPSGNGKPGVLDIDFTRIVFPSGNTKTLDASLISLDSKSVTRTDAGHFVAKSDKGKDRLKWVGIGAGAGFLISTLTKQNQFLSTLFGAGAGYLYNELSNKKPGDVNLKEGSEFGVRLDRQFAFNTNRPSYSAAYDRSDEYDRDFRTDRNRGSDDRYYHRADVTRPDRLPAYDSNDREEIGLLVNDRNVRFNSARPLRRNDTVLLPLDTVARAIGFEFVYDSQDRIIRARKGNLRMGIDSRIAVFNGERRRMEANAEMRNGVIYVPMRFIGLAANASVYYDAPSHTVVLTTASEREQ